MVAVNIDLVHEHRSGHAVETRMAGGAAACSEELIAANAAG